MDYHVVFGHYATEKTSNYCKQLLVLAGEWQVKSAGPIPFRDKEKILPNVLYAASHFPLSLKPMHLLIVLIQKKKEPKSFDRSQLIKTY